MEPSNVALNLTYRQGNFLALALCRIKKPPKPTTTRIRDPNIKNTTNMMPLSAEKLSGEKSFKKKKNQLNKFHSIYIKVSMLL